MFDETLVKVGNRLVENCRAGNEMQGLDELYAKDAVSVEAAQMPGTPDREAKGVDAIKAKHEWWNNATEVHEASVGDPMFHGGDRFAVIFRMDVTMKDSGDRMQMEEIGIYTVKGGKVVREEFYYAPMG